MNSIETSQSTPPQNIWVFKIHVYDLSIFNSEIADHFIQTYFDKGKFLDEKGLLTFGGKTLTFYEEKVVFHCRYVFQCCKSLISGGASGALIFIDTRVTSLNQVRTEVRSHLDEYKNHYKQDVFPILLACVRTKPEQTTRQEREALADELGAPYVEWNYPLQKDIMDRDTATYLIEPILKTTEYYKGLEF